MTLPAPLDLNKKDTPGSASAAALLTTALKTIRKGAPTLKTRQALSSFWSALSVYASRNLAEVEGKSGAPAAAHAKAVIAKAAAPKARKAKAAAEPEGQTATA